MHVRSCCFAYYYYYLFIYLFFTFSLRSRVVGLLSPYWHSWRKLSKLTNHRPPVYRNDVLKIAWEQAPQWWKKGNYIGEKREPSGGLGKGKGRRSLETCLWCRRSMIPDSGIMLWLVKCLHVDRFAVLLTVSRSFSVTLRPDSGKDFLKYGFLSEQAIQISLRYFSLVPLLQEEQKICLWSVA